MSLRGLYRKQTETYSMWTGDSLCMYCMYALCYIVFFFSNSRYCMCPRQISFGTIKSILSYLILSYLILSYLKWAGTYKKKKGTYRKWTGSYRKLARTLGGRAGLTSRCSRVKTTGSETKTRLDSLLMEAEMMCEFTATAWLSLPSPSTSRSILMVAFSVLRN